MFSEKAMKNAEACRFCWMCRHLCPVGLKTGKEVNTPRAKGLLISMNKRGFAFDKDSAQVMYECCLCGSCSNDCATGYEPPIFIREARTVCAVEGLTPPAVQTIVDNVQNTGNAYGLPAADKFAALQSELKDLPKAADVLLYIGATAAYRQPAIALSLMKLLKKAGVSFTVLRDEPTAGTELGDLLGYIDEVQAQARALCECVREIAPKTLVVLDPYDATTMKHNYPEWGVELGCEVVTATSFVAGLVKDGKLSFTKTSGTVTYHDSARLARDLDEHEPARELIAALGLTLKEMFLNRRMAKCCGSELLKAYAPGIALLTAQGRWEDAERAGVQTLVTACPEAYDVLSAAVPEGKTLSDLFTLLADHL